MTHSDKTVASSNSSNDFARTKARNRAVKWAVGCALVAGVVMSMGCASHMERVRVGSGVQVSLGAFGDSESSDQIIKDTSSEDYNEGGIAIDRTNGEKKHMLGAGDGLGIMIFDPMGNVQTVARANDQSPMD